MLIDSTAGVFHSDPGKLQRLFAVALEHRPHFHPQELGTILDHQLSTRVDFDLSTLDPGSQRLLQAASACGETGGVRTFRDLFLHPSPPIHLLQLTKSFAKNHLQHPDSPLPPEVATVLYYTSIATAWTRLHRRISELTPANLQQGLHQILSYNWLHPDLRPILSQTAQSFSSWQTSL
jgi:hypothetical protein